MEVLQRTANRGSISTGFNIDNSVKLEADNSEFFSRTPDSNSNRQTFTFSTWIKRTELGGINAILEAFQDGSNFFIVGIQNSDELIVYNIDSGTDYGYKYTKLFKDTAAWYHIVFKSDTTNGTAANRWQVYINGVEITATTADYGDPPQNYNSNLNSTISHNIGKREDQGTFMSCYLAETHLIDGTALAPTAFGEFDDDSGVWKPIEVSDVTYGTNGFYLNYITASDMGNDKSGENNDWAENNIAAADQATDTPTNNFCTINTPFEPLVGGPPTITEGATIMTAGSSGQQDSYGTMALFKGKWYFEFSVLNVGGLAIANMFGGVVKVNRLLQSSYNNAANGHHSHDGGWGGGVNAVGVHSGSGSGFSAVSGSAVDVVVGVAVDMDNGKIWWASGGTYASSSGTVSNPATATLPQFTNLLTQYPGEPVVPAFNHYVHQATTQGAFNFGNPFDHAFTDIGTNSDANGYGSFAYTPPSGYYAICSKNLAEYG